MEGPGWKQGDKSGGHSREQTHDGIAVMVTIDAGRGDWIPGVLWICGGEGGRRRKKNQG